MPQSKTYTITRTIAVGDFVEANGQLCLVSRIENESVYVLTQNVSITHRTNYFLLDEAKITFSLRPIKPNNEE
jgi:hypothetical protein